MTPTASTPTIAAPTTTPATPPPTTPPPPGQVSNLQVTMPAATTLTITWTVSGSIDRFEVTYSYTVNRCSAPQGVPRTDAISDGSMRSHTLRDLNEDSSYTITVRAINTAGSTMAMTTGSTSTAGNHSTLHDFIQKIYSPEHCNENVQN